MRFSYRIDEIPAIVTDSADMCAVLCLEGLIGQIAGDKPDKVADKAADKNNDLAGGQNAAGLRALDAALDGLITKLAAEEHFSGKKTQSLQLHTHSKVGPRRVLLLGIGKGRDFGLSDLRHAAARAVRAAHASRCQSLTLLLPDTDAKAAERVGEFVAEGVLLAGYQFDKYLSGERKRPGGPSEVRLVTACATTAALQRGIERGEKIAHGIMQARDLAHEQASELTPRRLAELAGELAAAHGLECEILGPKECAELGMGCFLGVARGSEEEPRLIHLAYRPKGKTPGRRIALIGKTVTFDSGGLSLKTNEGMLEMKYDMGGGGTVLSALGVLSRLDCPDEVHVVLAATENMPSGRAYKLGDVLRSMAGKTVEINNTDAEGRLTLADAMTFALSRIKPDEMLDFATLTGGAVIALGPHIAPVMSNNPELVQRFLAAAGQAGEGMWQLPLPERLFEALKSEIADMKNSGERAGGAMIAGLFLKEFVGEVPWVHVDMAGPVSTSKEWGHQSKGPTGFGVATLIEYLAPPQNSATAS